jgi:hypothetical protein
MNTKDGAQPVVNQKLEIYCYLPVIISGKKAHGFYAVYCTFIIIAFFIVTMNKSRQVRK